MLLFGIDTGSEFEGSEGSEDSVSGSLLIFSFKAALGEAAFGNSASGTFASGESDA